MKLRFVCKKMENWLTGFVLLVLLVMVACVPTAEPITVAGTRVVATAVPTEVPPTAVARLAPALLAQWHAGERQYKIRPVDATTGRDTPGYAPLSVGGTQMYELQTALSADGRMLAAIESNGQACESQAGGSACRARADALHLVDVEAWQSVVVALPGEGWAWPLLFSPDHTRLALAVHNQESSQVLLFDTTTGVQLGQQSISFRPTMMIFTAGGSLALAGAPEGENRGVTAPGPFAVQRLDGASLAVQWDQTLPEIVSGSWCTAACDGEHSGRRTTAWQPGVAASPDGRFLYIVHADADQLTTIDQDDGSVHSVPIQAGQSWLERLLTLTASPVAAKSLGDGAHKSVVVSADGRYLYVVGERWAVEETAEGEPMYHQDSLGLQVVDTTDGRLLETKETLAALIRLTPDGAYLVLDGWTEEGRWMEVWKTAGLEMVTRLEDRQVTTVPLLDGSYALLASSANGHQLFLSLMPPPFFKCAPTWMADGPIVWVAGQ